MLQKLHITLCAIIAGFFSVLFSPYTAVANTGKEPPCKDIRLLNLASQEWCRHEKGWGRDAEGRWVNKKEKKELKAPKVVDDANDKKELTSDMDEAVPPQSTVSANQENRLNRLRIKDKKDKAPEQQIFWTEGRRIPTDHIGHLPKGGWR